MKPVVIVMAKAPRAGTVKTRLSPPLAAEDAASLAACFARDVVANALSLPYPVLVAFVPDDGRAMLTELLPADLLWARQSGDTLGDRMQSALESASALGFSPLVMIGTDSPTLPSSHLERSIEILSADLADLVLGPAEDGGYYLIGIRKPIRGLFNTVAWSTPQALADTLHNAAELSLRVARLPVWYDVDTPADLDRLALDLRSNTAARKCAPRTYGWFRAHGDLDICSNAE
jgi:rSAM/selenodomain-associated transferase 1